MLVAVAAMAFVSCQKEDDAPVSESKSASLALQANVLDTKTYIKNNAILWGAGEYVRLYYNDGAVNYAKSTSESEDWSGETLAMFNFDITYDSADSYVLGGVYPASATEISDNNTEPAKFKVELPSTQNASASSYDPKAFIMIMKPEIVKTFDAQAYLVSFRRATALNKITLTGVKEPITSVEITVPKDKCLAGRRYFDLTTGVEGEIYHSQANTIKVNAEYTENSIDIWFTSWGVELLPGDELTIKMISAEKTYTRTITANENGIKFVEGDLNKLSISMSHKDVVEEVLDNLSGKYLIAAMPEKWVLMSDRVHDGGYYISTNTNVTSTASDVNAVEFYEVENIENYVWTVTKVDGGYAVKNNSTGKYLKLGKDGNNAYSSDDLVVFDIAVTDKLAVITDKTYTSRQLEYNSSSPRFAFYKNTQNDIYFIPWVEDSTPRITVSNNIIEVKADATSTEFTYILHNVTGTPEVNVADGATMSNVFATADNGTVTVEFDANTEGDAKSATLVLSIEGAEDVEVVINQTEYVDASAIEEITVEDFLEKSVDANVWYKLTGAVSNIVNTEYGNFNLTDATGTVYVYGLTKTQVSSNDKSFSSIGLKEGDVVTLIGTRAEYNNNAQVGGPAYYVSHQQVSAAPSISCKDNVVTITAAESATIYYTINGDDPTIESTEYEAAFGIEEDTTVKAIAVEDGKLVSSVTVANCIWVDPNSDPGDLPVVAPSGTVLWSETWADAGSTSTSFASNTAISSYDYSGRAGFEDNATSVTYASDASNNVRITKSSGANCTSGHLWFNKSVAGELKTSAIKLYGATSLKFSHSQGTSGSSCETLYSIDGGSNWISLGTQSGAIATKTYTFTVPVGTESIMIKLAHASSNAKNTRVDNLELKVN